MPGLKDLLKKKERTSEDAHQQLAPPAAHPEFTFIRSTTESEEVIQPPTYTDDDDAPRTSKDKRRTLGFRHSFHSVTSTSSSSPPLPAAADPSSQPLPSRPKGERRLSQRLHLHRRDRSRSTSAEYSSSNLPHDLPEAPDAVASPRASRLDGGDEDDEGEAAAQERREEQWEKRATMLAKNSPFRDGQFQAEHGEQRVSASGSENGRKGTGTDATTTTTMTTTGTDVKMQEAIRLHETGDIRRSTEMFATLADPRGANLALAQVLYGLALRHGWSCQVDAERAVHYLSLAAANSASIEEQALASGLRRGGAAKGELVLAIYELANCFRYGYGVKRDAVAARQYYETAANL
jgi:hypothetical protein